MRNKDNNNNRSLVTTIVLSIMILFLKDLNNYKLTNLNCSNNK